MEITEQIFSNLVKSNHFSSTFSFHAGGRIFLEFVISHICQVFLNLGSLSSLDTGAGSLKMQSSSVFQANLYFSSSSFVWLFQGSANTALIRGGGIKEKSSDLLHFPEKKPGRFNFCAKYSFLLWCCNVAEQEQHCAGEQGRPGLRHPGLRLGRWLGDWPRLCQRDERGSAAVGRTEGRWGHWVSWWQIH